MHENSKKAFHDTIWALFTVIQFYNKDIQSLQSKQITWLALVERRKRQLLGAKAF